MVSILYTILLWFHRHINCTLMLCYKKLYSNSSTILLCIQHPVSDLLEGKIPLRNLEVATSEMRGKILSQCCLSSTVFQR